MATETKQIILDIQTNYKDAINSIVQLTKQLDELQVEELKVKAAMKSGQKTQEDGRKELTALGAEIRNVKSSIREINKEIDTNIQKQEAQEGSIKQMRAQLKEMVKAYDELSAADRNSEAGQRQMASIKELQDQLKGLEGETGRFQRNVGDYRNAIQDAINGMVPLKGVLKDMRTEIQTLTLQQRMYSDEIKSQKAALDQLAATVGTDNDEYKEQSAALEDLQKKYKDTAETISNMQLAAGQIQDTIDDTNASIKNFGKDNANLKAVGEGMGVIANSYAVVQGAMAAVGAESEDLVKIWAKMQVVQQGINALNQITVALEKESVLRQQLQLVLNRLLGKSVQQTAKAKTEDAAASAAAATGNNALAASEVTATAAAGGLTAALKTVGAAIKSIPVIGWVIAAVAAIGALTALVIRHNRLEKEGNATLRERKALHNEIAAIQRQSLESTQEQTVKMEANIRHLKTLEEGTEEWDGMVKQVAEDLGVDAEWLGKNIDKVDDLKEAWVRLQTAMATADAAAKRMADNRIKIATAEADVQRVLEESGTKEKERVKALKEQLGISERMARNIAKAYHNMLDDNTAKNMAAYANAVNEWTESMTKQNNAFQTVMDSAFDDQMKAQDDLKETAEGNIQTTGKAARAEAAKTAESIEDTAKKLGEELEDIMVEGMVDGVEKQIAVMEKEAARWVAKMKEARDKDAKNAELYNKLIAEKERQTQEKIKKMRVDGYASVMDNVRKLNESYNDLWRGEEGGLFNFVEELRKAGDEVKKSIEELNKAYEENSRQTVYDISKANQSLASSIAEDYKAVLASKEFTDKFGTAVSESMKAALNAFVLSNGESGLDISDAVREAFPVLDEYKSRLAAIYDESRKTVKEIAESKNADNVARRVEMVSNAFSRLWTDSISKVVRDMETLPSLFSKFMDDDKLREFANSLKSVFTNGTLWDVEAFFSNGNLVPEDYKKQFGEMITNAQYLADIMKRVYGYGESKNDRMVNLILAMSDDVKMLESSFKDMRSVIYGGASDFSELLLYDKAKNKKLQQFARSVREVFLEEAKRGTLDIVPERFTVYIDFQRENLEKELAEVRGRIQELMREGVDVYNNKGLEELGKRAAYLSGELDNLNQVLANVSKVEAEVQGYTRADIEDSNFKSFFDNKELLENQLNLKEVQNQIDAVSAAMERGRVEQNAINNLEKINLETLNTKMYLENDLAKAQREGNEAEVKRLEKLIATEDEWLKMNQSSIDSHREILAALGYTTEEEMQQVLDTLYRQQRQYTKDSDKLFKQMASSVLSSFATVSSALAGLFNEIGEDNAEMANFLEGIAYVNIGVNMAAAIAEAVSSGAGMPFPYNLAAIATGIAAVVGAISEAISIYKQYHKNVTSPSFATGGLIGMRYARTRAEGRRDDVDIKASVGEYIVNAEAVKRLGVDFLDELNFGGKKRPRKKGGYADGGIISNTTIQKVTASVTDYDALREALSSMPSPIVSVKDISTVQNRVRVKEGIARK